MGYRLEALVEFTDGSRERWNWAWFLEYLYHSGRIEPPPRYERESEGVMIERLPFP